MSQSLEKLGRIDVVVFTATAAEALAVRAVEGGALGTWQEVPQLDGCEFPLWFATYRTLKGRPLRVLLTQTLPLQGPAANRSATALLAVCKPRQVTLCGVCAGRPGWVKLGDVIAADLVYSYRLGPAELGERKADVSLTPYEIPPAWKQPAARIALDPAASWLELRPPSEEEQQQWLLDELHAGRDPLGTPDWERQCPNWDMVLETLWRAGLLAPDEIELSDEGRYEVEQRAAGHSNGVPELGPPRVYVGPLGTGSSLAGVEDPWETLAEDEPLVRGLDVGGSVAEFLTWADQIDHVVVKGMIDLTSAADLERAQAFAARAAAEVLLELLRTVISAGSPVTQDLLSPHLPLEVAGSHASALLGPRQAVVPFQDQGRQQELAELSSWYAAEDPVSVRLFTGKGGSGKTRLLIESVRRLEEEGWAGGFLDQQTGAEDFARLLVQEEPLLVVFDAAASHPGLAEFLTLAAERPSDRPKLRVALLERQAGDWWQSLKKDETLCRLLDRYPPLQLEPLGARAPERRTHYYAAAQAFATRLERPSPAESAYDLSEWPFDRILFVHMAALADVLGLKVGGQNLPEGMLGHEQRAWLSVCREPGLEARDAVKAATRAMAAVALRGGVATRKEAGVLFDLVEGPARTEFLEALATMYPGGSALPAAKLLVAPIEPGLLAEAVVARALGDPATRESYLSHVFREANARAVQNGLVLLGRAIAYRRRDDRSGSDDPQAYQWLRAVLAPDIAGRALAALRAALALDEENTQDTLGSVLADALEESEARNVAQEVDALLPQRSASLREVACWSLRVQLDGPQPEEQRARLLGALAVRLAELGQLDAALDVTREAAESYRQLAGSQPDLYVPRLAVSLTNLGYQLSKLGRRDEALEATSEAVEIYRELAGTRPEAFLSNLAASLHNLSTQLSKLGQLGAAVDATRELVERQRRLLELKPETSPTGLATSLHNLGSQLTKLGQKQAALEATREAVELRRELARTKPESLPGLAGSLNNLGTQLAELGQVEAALAAAQEAVSNYVVFAQRQPAQFLRARADFQRAVDNMFRRLEELYGVLGNESPSQPPLSAP